MGAKSNIERWFAFPGPDDGSMGSFVIALDDDAAIAASGHGRYVAIGLSGHDALYICNLHNASVVPTAGPETGAAG